MVAEFGTVKAGLNGENYILSTDLRVAKSARRKTFFAIFSLVATEWVIAYRSVLTAGLRVRPGNTCSFRTAHAGDLVLVLLYTAVCCAIITFQF